MNYKEILLKKIKTIPVGSTFSSQVSASKTSCGCVAGLPSLDDEELFISLSEEGEKELLTGDGDLEREPFLDRISSDKSEKSDILLVIL